MTGKTEQVVIRIEPKLLKEAERMRKKMGHGTSELPSRASVLRRAIGIGLTQMRAMLKGGE